jgi:hypothetical protein
VVGVVSAVAERTGRTKFETLQDTLARRQAEAAELEAHLERLAAEESAAVDELLREKPSASPYSLHSRPQRLRAKQAKTRTELEGVRTAVATLERHVAEGARAHAIDEVRGRTRELRKLVRSSGAAWLEAGELFASLVGCWNTYAAVLEERLSLVAEVRVSEALGLARMIDPEAASAWDEADQPPEGVRVPLDLGAFLEVLIEVGLDPHNEGFRPATSEVIVTNADASMRPHGEPAQKRTVVSTGSNRYSAHMSELVPDLRGQDKRVQGDNRQAEGVSTFARRSAAPSRQIGGVIGGGAGRESRSP